MGQGKREGEKQQACGEIFMISNYPGGEGVRQELANLLPTSIPWGGKTRKGERGR